MRRGNLACASRGRPLGRQIPGVISTLAGFTMLRFALIFALMIVASGKKGAGKILSLFAIWYLRICFSPCKKFSLCPFLVWRLLSLLLSLWRQVTRPGWRLPRLGKEPPPLFPPFGASTSDHCCWLIRPKTRIWEGRLAWIAFCTTPGGGRNPDEPEAPEGAPAGCLGSSKINFVLTFVTRVDLS